MHDDPVLTLLLNGARLKQTPRSGWLQRGVPHAENVAAHSYGVVLTTLALAQLVTPPVDLARALAIAALHDLPEALVTDIPAPAKRFMPDAALKTTIERNALAELTAAVPFGADWRALWDAYAADESAAAQLVKDADTLDMLIQAYTYEQQTGNRQLAQFWQQPYSFHYPAAQALYAALLALRAAAAND